MSNHVTGGWSSTRCAAETADVLLLRHGETQLTPQRRFSGVGGGNPELSAVGCEQAHRAACSPLVSAQAIIEIVCSPLRRCRETAEIIASQLGLRVVVDENLREVDFGQWEGMTYAEVEERYPHDLSEWKRSAEATPTGSPETFSAVLDRMGTVAGQLASRYAGGSVVAVTHVTPIKALVAHALGAPALALFAMELSPAAFSRIAYTGTEASVRLFNDTSHLR